MQLMGVQGVTIGHVKSYLQKCRLREGGGGGGELGNGNGDDGTCEGSIATEGGKRRRSENITERAGTGVALQTADRRRPSAGERSAARARAVVEMANEAREAAFAPALSTAAAAAAVAVAPHHVTLAQGSIAAAEILLPHAHRDNHQPTCCAAFASADIAGLPGGVGGTVNRSANRRGMLDPSSISLLSDIDPSVVEPGGGDSIGMPHDIEDRGMAAGSGGAQEDGGGRGGLVGRRARNHIEGKKVVAHVDLDVLADDYRPDAAVLTPSFGANPSATANITPTAGVMVGGVGRRNDNAGASAGFDAAVAATLAGVTGDTRLIQALMRQTEMQTQLHEHLVAQRRMQQAVDAHGRYLECLVEQERMRRGQPPLSPLPPPPPPPPPAWTSP
jgi:hypothetical protein